MTTRTQRPADTPSAIARSAETPDPVGWKLRTLAGLLDVPHHYVSDRCRARSCAHLALGPRCHVVVDGDHGALVANRPETDFHQDGPDGRDTIERVLAGRGRIEFYEVAALLGVTERTVYNWAARGDMPFKTDRVGRYATRGSIRKWLLSKRVPARWEVQR
tara:strand:+ start:83264 stop:83746 length:483 start_codon:yes stop_codon:yes gene_type:complete